MSVPIALFILFFHQIMNLTEENDDFEVLVKIMILILSPTIVFLTRRVSGRIK